MKKRKRVPDATKHIPAQCGAPYVLERHGKTFHLWREVATAPGRPAYRPRLLFDRKDVIAVCNGLIDLTERDAAP